MNSWYAPLQCLLKTQQLIGCKWRKIIRHLQPIGCWVHDVKRCISWIQSFNDEFRKSRHSSLPANWGHQIQPMQQPPLLHRFLSVLIQKQNKTTDYIVIASLLCHCVVVLVVCLFLVIMKKREDEKSGYRDIIPCYLDHLQCNWRTERENTFHWKYVARFLQG